MTSQMSASNFNLLGKNSFKEELIIKNVWNHNLHEEFHVIRKVTINFITFLSSCDILFLLKNMLFR